MDEFSDVLLDPPDGSFYAFWIIPADVRNHILSFLPIEELLKCATVCKEWNSFFDSEQLWKTLYLRRTYYPLREEDLTTDFENETIVTSMKPSTAYDTSIRSISHSDLKSSQFVVTYTNESGKQNEQPNNSPENNTHQNQGSDNNNNNNSTEVQSTPESSSKSTRLEMSAFALLKPEHRERLLILKKNAEERRMQAYLLSLQEKQDAERSRKQRRFKSRGVNLWKRSCLVYHFYRTLVELAMQLSHDPNHKHQKLPGFNSVFWPQLYLVKPEANSEKFHCRSPVFAAILIAANASNPYAVLRRLQKGVAQLSGTSRVLPAQYLRNTALHWAAQTGQMEAILATLDVQWECEMKQRGISKSVHDRDFIALQWMKQNENLEDPASLLLMYGGASSRISLLYQIPWGLWYKQLNYDEGKFGKDPNRVLTLEDELRQMETAEDFKENTDSESPSGETTTQSNENNASTVASSNDNNNNSPSSEAGLDEDFLYRSRREWIEKVESRVAHSRLRILRLIHSLKALLFQPVLYLTLALQHGPEEAVSYLLDKISLADLHEEAQNTLLCKAILYAPLSVIKMIVQRGYWTYAEKGLPATCHFVTFALHRIHSKVYRYSWFAGLQPAPFKKNLNRLLNDEICSIVEYLVKDLGCPLNRHNESLLLCHHQMLSSLPSTADFYPITAACHLLFGDRQKAGPSPLQKFPLQLGLLEGPLRSLIELGADVTVVDPEGMTPLMNIVSMGYLSLVEPILRACPETITQKDPRGRTALVVALQKGPQKVVDLLIQHNAPIDSTTLSIAVLSASCQINLLHFTNFKILPPLSTTPNLLVAKSWTDPEISYSKGKIVLRLVLWAAKRFTSGDNFPSNLDSSDPPKTGKHETESPDSTPNPLPLQQLEKDPRFLALLNGTAASSSKVQTVQHLVEDFPLLGDDPANLLFITVPPLLAACKGGPFSLIKKFIEWGADPRIHITRPFEANALTLCARYGTIESVQYFLDQGVDINSIGSIDIDVPPSTTTGTVLSIAARHQRMDVVEHLLKLPTRELLVNMKTAGGKSPLFYILEYCSRYPQILDVVKLMVEREQGANVNDTDESNGWSILHYAALYAPFKVAKYLVRKGAIGGDNKFTPANALSLRKKDDEEGQWIYLLLQQNPLGQGLASLRFW